MNILAIKAFFMAVGKNKLIAKIVLVGLGFFTKTTKTKLDDYFLMIVKGFLNWDMNLMLEGSEGFLIELKAYIERKRLEKSQQPES